MASKEPKIAWCLIVKADDREAELLDRLLGCEKLPKERKINFRGVTGLAKNVDKLFITITGKNERCEEVAKKYGAEVSYYEWDRNFAKARNFNFSQVPEEYDYIGWSDADDVIKNGHLIRGTVKHASENAIDAVVMRYLYDFDTEGQCIVEHLKTRIVKNDGTAVWAGSIHEDFAPERQWLAVESKDVQMFHLTDTERVEIGKKRNTEIASIGLAENRNDPRSYWNLANAYITEGRDLDALPVFFEFLDKSQSEEERFLAWHRVAAIFKNHGDLERAIATELEALSLRPWYPEAYFALGEMYLKVGRLNHAKEMLEMGFTKKPPQQSIIVWNPRDYDYNPRMVLGQVYLQLKKPREAIVQFKKCQKIYPRSNNLKKLLETIEPELKQFEFAEDIYKKALQIKDKEELKKLLDSVPDEMKHYPAIASLRNNHFIKETSSGKDLVIFCGYTSNPWDPEIAATRGVGGSEEAVIQLAKRWKDAGYNVTVYANIGHKEGIFDGVRYVPFMSWNYRDKQDITILWRHPKQLDYNINSDVVLVDMHDVVPRKEWTKDRVARVTKVMFKSWAHRHFYPQIPDDKVVVIPHGLDIKQFEERRTQITKNPYKIVNTSSPDRGLLTNLEIVEELYKRLPEELKPKLKFRWNYGFRVWDGEFSSDEQMVAWKQKAMAKLQELKDRGIVEEESGDMISQDAIVDQYLESGLLLYPSEFFEIGFISGKKAILAGAIPVTTDVFAQGEYLKEGIIVHSDVNYDNWIVDVKNGVDYGIKKYEQKEFVINKLLEYFSNPAAYDEMRTRLIQYAKDNFDWDKTANAWVEIFKQYDNKQIS